MTTELRKALVGALSELKNPVKDADNPFFKSKYVELSTILDLVRPVLEKHGLAVSQPVVKWEDKMYVKTTILHETGEMTMGLYPVVPKRPKPIKDKKGECIALDQGDGTDDPQAMGSAITYARRYSLCAALSIAGAGEDDDGNRASRRSDEKPGKSLERQLSDSLALESMIKAAGDVSTEGGFQLWKEQARELFRELPDKAKSRLQEAANSLNEKFGKESK
jgi:hypothetical protein